MSDPPPRGRGGRGGRGYRGGPRGGGDFQRGGYQGGDRGGDRGGYRGGRGGDRGGDHGDRGGRGDFRGGFRGGDRGDRGGRGDFRGGDRGGDRGGRGDFRGGDRGDFRGRGRGRGGYDGGRGGYDGGGRGRGGFDGGRGGRGGYRGGRGGRGGGAGGGYDGDVFTTGDDIPEPDPDVTQLENTWVSNYGTTSLSELTGQVSNLGISAPGLPSINYFPYRPAYGGTGNEITLWANCFKLNVKVQALSKYSIEVHPIPPEVDEKSETGGKSKSSEKPPPREPRGRKLKYIIERALAQLPKDTLFASEFKGQIISFAPLKLPENGMIPVVYADTAKSEAWNVRFSGPTPMRVADLMTYLSTMHDPVGDRNFPKFPDEIDALNVILGHTPRADPTVTAVGKSRFFAHDQDRLESGDMPPISPLAILRGYFQSVRPATGRLLLNTSVTHGVFRRPATLADLFDELDLGHMGEGVSGYQKMLFESNLKKLHKFLNKARIQCKVLVGPNDQYELRSKVVFGLARFGDGKRDNKPPKFSGGGAFGGPNEVSFFVSRPLPSADGQPAPDIPDLPYDQYHTVGDYYLKKYGREAISRYPLVNIGTLLKPIYFLAENCRIEPGQPLKSKLTAQEQDAMIQFACRSPPANAQSITTKARQILGLDNNELLRQFGISVDKTLVTVKARELPPPSVVYQSAKSASPSHVDPKDGGWLMKNVKVAKAGRRIETWTFLVILGTKEHGKWADDQKARAKQNVGKFASFLAHNMGININPHATPADGVSAHYDNGEASLKAAFQTLADGKTPPQLVMVVLPEKSTPIYNTVKKLADVDFGFQTVCVVRNKVSQEKGQMGYFANVGLKVNMKFGGVNHLLKDEIGLIKKGKTMMAGYDVTHPTNVPAGMDAENMPSLVGLVASIDTHLSQWPAVTWNNPGGQEELGSDLRKMFESRLMLWQKHNAGQLPENIIIFRDGVSDGQFKMVLEKEVPHIRAACEKLYPKDRQPRITLIVSVKRHQVRFMPTDAGHMHPRSKSPKEGTIVDRGVTNARLWDFYLQAHASLQGTARPAHYTVLLDEIFRAEYGEDSANALEKLTHDMCYLYGRATKAVSICPPAYYADLVCTRARVHKNELFDDNDSLSSSQKGRIEDRKVHTNLDDTMYYI